MKVQMAKQLVNDEYKRACEKHNPFTSAHEGIAVIEEEFLQLRTVVYHDPYEDRHLDSMREYAIKLTAMGLRFLSDICEYDNDGL